MKTRQQAYGDANLVGHNIERLRIAKSIKQKDFIARIKASGLDTNPTSYSKLEGQIRLATDKELLVIAHLLNVKVDDLYPEGFPFMFR